MKRSPRHVALWLLLSLAATITTTTTTLAQTDCSRTCDESYTCSGDTIVGCDASCGINTCSETVFNRSSVELLGTECESCSFFISSVTTDGPFGAYSFNEPTFGFCSCCDDTSGQGNCPEGVPSCTGTANAQELCATENLQRTCKDWGNPVCADLNVPSLPAKTTESTCSQGLETVWCQDQGCANLVVANCTTMCLSGSCEGAHFDDSVVGCYHYNGYTESCNGASFERSFVELSATECEACSFWFSAVTTATPFGGYSFSEPLFPFCSCCDDISGSGHCPDGVPSCRSNPEEFCAMEVHAMTCQDWGNPVCSDLQVPVPSVPSKVNASTCSENLDTVWCREEGACEGLQASNCRALCVDGSCSAASFKESDVGCYHYAGYTEPCTDSIFERSLVTLQDTECESCSFWFSAVTTNSAFGGYSFDKPTFGFCSCCDDTSGQRNCPVDVPSCSNPESFCSTTHLGQSCKEWGNPICDTVENIAVDVGDVLNNMTYTNGTNVTVDDPISVCPLTMGDEFLVCAGTDCGGLETTSCTIECYNEACGGAQFEDSSVACLGLDTCTEARFSRSLVDCATSNCGNSDFFSSALTCHSSGEEESCDHVLLSRCTCCDGANCPEGANSCQVDPTEFCANRSFLGRNCNDWGHPFCDDVNVPSLPPLHPAETCSLGEEIYFCDEGDIGCLGLIASNCTVSCHGKVCNQASFEDSFVQCFDRAIPGWFEVYPGEGCVNTRFTRSVASCQNSCVGATFDDSIVLCDGPSCTLTNFQGCSCCDGDGCPFGVPACEGNLDAICSRVIEGETCACRGFPLCEEEYTASCPGSSSLSKGALLALDRPLVKTKAAVSKEAEAGKAETETKETESVAASGPLFTGRGLLCALFVVSFLTSF